MKTEAEEILKYKDILVEMWCRCRVKAKMIHKMGII
jgi:hypothetical protein